MKLIKNVIIPVATILLLAYLGQHIYIVDEKIGWLRLCLVLGIPFGVPYMLWVIPIGGNPTNSVVILALNLIIGAIFGCLIAAIALIRAIIFVVIWIVSPKNRCV